MKTLVISSTLLLALAALANAMPPHHLLPPHEDAAKEVCLKKLDLTVEKLHESRESGEAEKDRNCFLACMSKELGLMTADGNIDREAALKIFPPFIPEENRTRIVDACYQKKGADDCETAQQYFTCVEKLKPPPPMSPEFKKVHDSCKAELSLTDEDIEKRKNSKEEYKSDCFLFCIGKGFGLLNEDGALNKEKFVSEAPPHMKEKAGKVAEECGKEEAANGCEAVVLLYKCFTRNHFNIGHLYGPPRPPGPHRDD